MATENSENFLSNAFNSIGEYVNSVLDAASDSQQVAGYSVAEIGKPFKFATTVDPLDRGYRFLATRMNVIDLYPCNYALNYLYNNSSKKSMFKYGIGYDKAMEKYRKMCTDYLGLLNPPSALRIFLTDDTTTTDGIVTEYTDNFFQKKADDLSNKLQNFTALGTSLSSAGMHSAVDKVLADSINTDKIVGYVSGGLGLSQKASDSLGTVIEGLKQGAAIVLKGNKLSLPKIWQNSSYRPTFSISTKLFSPYGSPKAVQEYIVKPLTMILLMSTPQSDDMISYNRPFAVTVRSWGTSFLTLAGITSVTLQRGGSDSVYSSILS